MYRERCSVGEALKRVPAVFYRAANGNEPVRDWLRDLTIEDRRHIGYDIALVEFGWPIGMPVCRPLKGGLWEVRSDITEGIARVIFCFAEGQMVLLHGFIKKTQQTPPKDLALARARKREIET